MWEKRTAVVGRFFQFQQEIRTFIHSILSEIFWNIVEAKAEIFVCFPHRQEVLYCQSVGKMFLVYGDSQKDCSNTKATMLRTLRVLRRDSLNITFFVTSLLNPYF